MSSVIRFIGTPTQIFPEDARPYLVDFVDTPDGRGKIESSLELAKAKRFAGVSEALRFYMTQSKYVPLRPDLRPNRPLTAYTVDIRPVD